MTGSINPIHYPSDPPQPNDFQLAITEEIKVSQLAHASFSSREWTYVGSEDLFSSVELIPPDPNLRRLQSEASKIKIAIGETDAVIRSVECLKNLPADLSLKQFMETHETELVGALLKNSPDLGLEDPGEKHAVGKFTHFLCQADGILEILGKYFLKPSSDVLKLSKYATPLTRFIYDATERIDATRFGLDVLAFPFEGIEFLLRAYYLQAAKNELDKLKLTHQPTPKIFKKMRQLKNFIHCQTSTLSELAISIGMKTLSFIPSSTRYVYELAKLPLPSNAGIFFSTFEPIIPLLAASFRLGYVQKASTLHEKWKTNPNFEDWQGEIPRLPSIGEKEKVLSLDNANVPYTYAKELYEKRKKAFEKRKEAKQADFNAFMTNIENGHAISEREFRLLEKAQATWQEKTGQAADCRNSQFRDFLFNFSIEHEEAIAISTRNGLKILSKLKPVTEDKFFSFKLNKERFLFVLTLLASAAVIVMEVLALASVIAIPIAAQAVPGLGIALAGIMLFALGLYLFYRYKPNLFKTTMQGVQIRLIYSKLTLAISEYSLKRKKIKLAAETEKIEFIQTFILQDGKIKSQEDINTLLAKLKPSVRKKINKAHPLNAKVKMVRQEIDAYLRKQANILTDVASLEKEVEKKKAHVEKLAARIRNASAADFLRSAGLEDMHAASENKEKKTNFENRDIFKIIADGIIDGNWKFDKDTKRILEIQMGIPLDEIGADSHPETLREELCQALKDFFGMDASQLVDFYKKQNIQFDFS